MLPGLKNNAAAGFNIYLFIYFSVKYAIQSNDCDVFVNKKSILFYSCKSPVKIKLLKVAGVLLIFSYFVCYLCFYLASFPQAIMFWVVDNFLMRKKKKLFQTDDPRRNANKVKYEKRTVVNGSDEEAVLLDNMAEGESLTIADEVVHHRDTVRR